MGHNRPLCLLCHCKSCRFQYILGLFIYFHANFYHSFVDFGGWQTTSRSPKKSVGISEEETASGTAIAGVFWVDVVFANADTAKVVPIHSSTEPSQVTSCLPYHITEVGASIVSNFLLLNSCNWWVVWNFAPLSKKRLHSGRWSTLDTDWISLYFFYSNQSFSVHLL